jgi:hypothetical protein
VDRCNNAATFLLPSQSDTLISPSSPQIFEYHLQTDINACPKASPVFTSGIFSHQSPPRYAIRYTPFSLQFAGPGNENMQQLVNELMAISTPFNMSRVWAPRSGLSSSLAARKVDVCLLMKHNGIALCHVRLHRDQAIIFLSRRLIQVPFGTDSQMDDMQESDGLRSEIGVGERSGIRSRSKFRNSEPRNQLHSLFGTIVFNHVEIIQLNGTGEDCLPSPRDQAFRHYFRFGKCDCLG